MIGGEDEVEILQGGCKTKCFARACQIPDNQILPIKNISKSHVLNGEEADDAAFYETICSLFLNLWKIREVARVLTILGITYHTTRLRFVR